MPNICVKYVNNQRIINSISGGNISTNKLRLLYKHTAAWLQSQLINQNIPYSSPTLSTHKNLETNLLNKSFTHNPQHLLLRLINEI